jgi:hypothetical protein
MKTITFKNNWLTATGFLLVIPTVYFILIGVLSEFGINGPLEAIQPLAEKWGIKDPPGLNITSVILFGPIVAFLLTIFQFMKIEWRLTNEEFIFHLNFYKRWFPILVAAASVGVLAILFFYMLGENCNC